jgi:hypothetical protein
VEEEKGALQRDLGEAQVGARREQGEFEKAVVGRCRLTPRLTAQGFSSWS